MKNKSRAKKKKKSVYTAQEATLLFMHAEFYLTEMALGRLKAQKLKQNFFGTIYKVMTSLLKNLGSPLALCELSILLILLISQCKKFHMQYLNDIFIYFDVYVLPVL